MEERVIATECRTCGLLVPIEDNEAVRYSVPLEGKAYVHHADCWRNGRPTREVQNARHHSNLHTGVSD